MTQRGVSRFLPNTAALVATAAISTILTVVQVKILAAHLTMDLFGQFASLRGLSLLLSMLAANGLPQLLVRFLPVSEARGDVVRALSLILGSLAVCVALFVVLAFAVTIFEGRVFDEFEITLGLHFWFMATTLGVAVKLVVYGGFSGIRRMVAQTVVETLTLAAQVGWIYARRDDLTLAGLFEILGTIAIASAAVALPWLIARTVRDVRRGLADANAAAVGVGYGGYWFGATGLSIVALAFTDVDRYLLSRVLAMEMLSLFHVASRVVRLANRFLGVPVLAFQPEVSRVEAEGRGDVVAFTTRVFLKFNAVVSLFVTSVIIVYGREIIVAIASIDYVDALPFLVILALSIPLTTLTAPLTAVMKALDRVRSAFLCDLVYAVAYVPLLLLLGARYGLTGAAAATVVACVLQFAVAVRSSRVAVGMQAVGLSVAKTAACAVVSFSIPVVVGLAGASVILKIAAVIPAIFVYRATVRVAGALEADERGRLLAMFGGGVRGRAVRWLLG